MSAVLTPAADLIGEKPATPPPSQISSPNPPTPSQFPPDKLGRTFDAAKFYSQADGSPRLDALGRFIPSNGGRKPKTAPAGPPPLKDGGSGASQLYEPKGPEAPKPPDRHALGAQVLIGLLQAGLISLGQEEGKLTDAEKTALADPLEKVLKKYDAGELPPELALLIVAASIVAPRLSQPKTQTSVQRIRAWFGGKLAALHGSRVARAVSAEVRPDPAS